MSPGDIRRTLAAGAFALALTLAGATQASAVSFRGNAWQWLDYFLSGGGITLKGNGHDLPPPQTNGPGHDVPPPTLNGIGHDIPPPTNNTPDPGHGTDGGGGKIHQKVGEHTLPPPFNQTIASPPLNW
ncbi:MAG TPA: hypothetical protein VGS07_19965 [Thermoanaerobaculia bacterium]|jgi:hypothetical protein|nr:hypothetical protein [Thermoanaerobaculia bacterium]